MKKLFLSWVFLFNLFYVYPMENESEKSLIISQVLDLPIKYYLQAMEIKKTSKEVSKEYIYSTVKKCLKYPSVSTVSGKLIKIFTAQRIQYLFGEILNKKFDFLRAKNFLDIQINVNEKKLSQKEKDSFLRCSIEKNNLQEVIFWLENGAQVESCNDLLHQLARHGRVNLLQILFVAGANLETQDVNKHTPLEVAIINKQFIVVQLLVYCYVKVKKKYEEELRRSGVEIRTTQIVD